MAKPNLPNNHPGRNRPRRNGYFFWRASGKAIGCKELAAQVSPRGADIKVCSGITDMDEQALVCSFCLAVYPMERRQARAGCRR